MATSATDDLPQGALVKRLHGVADTLQLVSELADHKRPSALKRNVALATLDGDDPEDSKADSPTKSLHYLRVSCRRAEIALQASPQQLTEKQFNWFHDRLRSIRKSCNALRDDEILRKWLRQQPEADAQQQLLKTISRNIKAGHIEAAKQARTVLQRHHFRRHVHDLWPTAEAASSDQPLWRGSFGRWLFHVLNRFIQTIPDNQHDFTALHQLRIAGKQLRYGSEFATELAPDLRLRGLTLLLEELQDNLGSLHDAVVRLDRLESELSKNAEADELIEAARGDLQQCENDWKAWWQLKPLQQIVRQAGLAVTKLLVSDDK